MAINCVHFPPLATERRTVHFPLHEEVIVHVFTSVWCYTFSFQSDIEGKGEPKQITSSNGLQALQDGLIQEREEWRYRIVASIMPTIFRTSWDLRGGLVRVQLLITHFLCTVSAEFIVELCSFIVIMS